MAKPFFSIIIPTLNEEKYLPNLLRDLSLQTFRNFEVIVVDGQSEDKTVALAKSISTTLSSLTILNSPQRNVCAQRNLGAKNARADILLFMDADIRIENYFLSGVEYRLLSDPSDFATCWIKPDVDTQSNAAIAYAMNVYTELGKNSPDPLFSESLTIATKNAFNKVGMFSENVFFAESRPLIKQAKKLGYRYTVYHDPVYTFSFRRIREFGVLSLLENIAQHELARLSGNKLTAKQVRQMYPMHGGSLFDEKISQRNKNRFIKNIDKALSKITIKDKPLSLKILKKQLNHLLEI